MSSVQRSPITAKPMRPVSWPDSRRTVTYPSAWKTLRR